MKHPVTRALSLVAVVLLAVSCSGNGDGVQGPEPTPTTTEPTAKATDGPTDGELGGTVTLITHDSFNVSDSVIAAFEEETGVTLEVLPSGDAGSMLNQAILTKDDPQGDVIFGVDNTFLSRALDAELFVPYESPALENVPDRFVLDAEYRVTPIDYGDVCLNYDKSYFEEQDLAVPETLAELVQPEYEDLLVVQNPATSSPGLAFLLATIQEFDDWTAYWDDLRANGVLVTDGWEQAYYSEFSGGASEGERPLVVSYASSPPAEVIFAETPPEEAPTGVILASCFRQIEFAGILEGTDNQAGAEALVDFMLSDTFQSDIPLNMFVFPVNETVDLPAAFVEHTTIPDDPITMDYPAIGENRERWVEEWTQTVIR